MPHRRKPTAPQTSQTVPIPAPTGGINTAASGTVLPPGDCVQAINLIAAENGLRSRLGYREWVTGVEGVGGDEVRSMIPFSGSDASQDRLFAVTNTTIWDASNATATPSIVHTFTTTGNETGFGVSCVAVTAGGHFLLYADEENGYHVYSEVGNTWAEVQAGAGATEIDGLDPRDIVFVTTFKGRVWFVERASTRAWFLPPGQIYGTVEVLDISTQFRAGGQLVGLWSWTYDGGAGLDDSLVAISTSGDVVIYQGTDPTSATDFGLKGVWYIGDTPAGRKIVREVGGDLLLLSRFGILPISRLVVGATADQYTTFKISNLFNQLMLTRAELDGWSMHLHPEDNSLLVVLPDSGSETNQQLAQAQGTPGRGWFRYEDLPIFSAEVWGGQLYFGTKDGRVCVSTGYVDAVRLADPNDYTPVQWQLLTAFGKFGGGLGVRISAIRTLLIAEGQQPAFEVAARYDYDQTALDAVSLSTPLEGNVWDAAVWDDGTWDGIASPYNVLRGATGMGHSAAVAIRGTAIERTILVGMDALAESGGWL